jgi:hypothetical protein
MFDVLCGTYSGVIRTNSMASLRSDGSDSEILKRLEQLNRQLNDKEARMKEYANRPKLDTPFLSSIDEQRTAPIYMPPSYRTSPDYSSSTVRRTRQRSPLTNDRLLRVLHDDNGIDKEFQPNYFRDDSILMRTTGDYVSPSKRVDLVDGMFVTNLDETVRRRQLHDLQTTTDYFDRNHPTSMANLELSVC